jgi:hypothetical protein
MRRLRLAGTGIVGAIAQVRPACSLVVILAGFPSEPKTK